MMHNNASILQPISRLWPSETSMLTPENGNGYRKRDERYADQGVHGAKPDPQSNTTKPAKQSKCFNPSDFRLAEDRSHCVGPPGKQLYSNGSNCTNNCYVAIKFGGAKQDCVPCSRRNECLLKPRRRRRGNKRLHCFTLRGKTKVDGQWKLYCMMHDIEKLAKNWYAR